jgi:hypothetical protein
VLARSARPVIAMRAPRLDRSATPHGTLQAAILSPPRHFGCGPVQDLSHNGR